MLLLVEDNAINARVALMLLEKAGFKADHVTNGAEAVEKFRTGAYPGVLMDCHMPVMDGYEASRHIRDLEASPSWERPPCRIIAMTANVMAGEKQRCLEAGMDDYVPKPVSPPELLAALAKLESGLPGVGEESAVAEEDDDGDAGILATLKQLSDELGEDNVAELLEEWMDDFPQAQADLERLADGPEQKEMRRAAHSLKGSSSLFGVGIMEDLLNRLEQLAAREMRGDQKAMVHELNLEWMRVQPVLEAGLAILKSPPENGGP